MRRDYDALLARDRRRPDRAARRGQPRHARVLPRARPDHEAPDRRARLHRGRDRGRLARRVPRQPLHPRRARRRRRRGGAARASGASRPGCGATPTCSTSSAGCAPTTTACTARARKAGFYGLDLYSLARVDGGRHRLSRRAGSRTPRPARAARYECLQPFGGRERARTARRSCSASASHAGGA